MSILIFCGPIDNDFFNCRTNLLNKLCDIYVTVHSVLSNVAKNHSRLPAGMIFQTPVVSDVNSFFFRFSTYFSSGFLQKRGKSTFTSTTISRKRQNTLPVLFSIFFIRYTYINDVRFVRIFFHRIDILLQSFTLVYSTFYFFISRLIHSIITFTIYSCSVSVSSRSLGI